MKWPVGALATFRGHLVDETVYLSLLISENALLPRISVIIFQNTSIKKSPAGGYIGSFLLNEYTLMYMVLVAPPCSLV